MHRYGGIWTGDNSSWWEHLLLNIKMMPSLNMCGFLYCGADLGGFGSNTTYDLMVRWLQFGIFTPLMRNHSALGTRNQELYQFSSSRYFSKLLKFRYQLIPYLYSEYIKAAKLNTLFFSPLSFEYSQDSLAVSIEDQLLVGDSLMIAPLYIQNSSGRYVYLPEQMLMIRFDQQMKKTYEVLSEGHHYLSFSLEEFALFIRPNKLLVLGNTANNTGEMDHTSLELIGFSSNLQPLQSLYYTDDGITTDIDLNTSIQITVVKEEKNWVATSADPNLKFVEITILSSDL